MDFDDLDAQAGCRCYDITVHGATGITGCLIVEHLDQLLQQEGAPTIKWCISGRNEEKLKKIASRLKSPPDTLVAESQDDLDYMAEMTSVVIAAAGPYCVIGQPVVEACVRKNTHYIDVTGEIVYNRRIIDAYHEQAKEKGIQIVVMSGFMSACSDMNIYLLAQKLGPLKFAREYIMNPASVRGGGSFLSGFSQFEHMTPTEHSLLIDPFSLGGARKCGVRPEDKDTADAGKDPVFPNVWVCTSFIGHPGVRVARRSCELFEASDDDVKYGEEVLIQSCDATFQEGQAKMNAKMAKPPEDMRKIILNAQAMEDGLMKGTGGIPGHGAPRETRRMCRSEAWAVGENEKGEWGYVHLQAPEGYEFTSMAAVNGALVMIQEEHLIKPTERGGVVTPAFAYHGSTFFDRMKEQSWGFYGGKKSKWDVVEGKLDEKTFEDAVRKVDEESKAFIKKMQLGEVRTQELPELLTGAHLK